MPLRSTDSLITRDARSAADTLRSPPPKVATAVRTGATIATPRMVKLLIKTG